jgi:cell division protein FtsL
MRKSQPRNFSGPFSGVVVSRQQLVMFVLALVVLVQAVGVIYVKQSKRNLHAKLQSMYSSRDKLQEEWSQLLLEQGTWEANARVERVAREQLGMTVPEKVNLILP